MSSISHQPSAVSDTLSRLGADTACRALPIEVLHNLRYQHGWKELQLYQIVSNEPTIVDLEDYEALQRSSDNQSQILISGRPPRHSYIHPDFLSQLVQHGIKETDVPIQLEWILPISIGEKCSLRKLAAMFDTLPVPLPRISADGVKHQDVKRVLLAMLAHNGAGGDGTIVYYIMQDGEIKPRQN